ncbi:MAG: ribbon-helix-helix protein, CopG family [Waterburya sp.]
MARPGGNPDFGTKYKFDFGRNQPLTEQVKAVVYPEMKQQLQKLAQERKCTVPDLIRDALEQYLATAQS